MMLKDATHGSTCVFNLNFHLVFCTKYRKKVFSTTELQNSMEDIIRNVCHNSDIIITNLKVMEDHVHMLIKFHPKYAPSDIVKKIKASSSKIWNNNFPDIKAKFYGDKNVLWSPGYYLGSLGNMSKSVVDNYIKNQYT